MTTFADHQHPRTGDGVFTTNGHLEAQFELAAPIDSLFETIRARGPISHGTDSRPSFEYTQSEAAATAFRAQFGATPDTAELSDYVYRSIVLGHTTFNWAVPGHGMDLTGYKFAGLDMNDAVIGTHANERCQSAEEPVFHGFGTRIYEVTTTRFFSALAGAR